MLALLNSVIWADPLLLTFAADTIAQLPQCPQVGSQQHSLHLQP